MLDPTTEIWLHNADNFYRKKDCPNYVGAIDGKHVSGISSRKCGSNFVKYKIFFYIALLAVVDANLNFMAIDEGSLLVFAVFRDSLLDRELYSGQQNLSSP